MERVKHTIRRAYGFTDNQIYDHIAESGQGWAIDSYEMIMEDEYRYWNLLISVAPLSRTPMDKKFSKELTKYTKQLRKNIGLTVAPWIEERRIEAIRERLSKPPDSKTYDERGNEVDLNDPDWWKREV